jgi:hypothetical protein
MAVISFHLVSVGSSTVQLHESVSSRRACRCSGSVFSSQVGDFAWSVCHQGAASVVLFLWAQWLDAKDIYKEMFRVYGGKCLSRKAVHNWVEIFSQGHSKVADGGRPGAELAGITVKRVLCCGLGTTGKAMGQAHQSWRRICREINAFS